MSLHHLCVFLICLINFPCGVIPANQGKKFDCKAGGAEPDIFVWSSSDSGVRLQDGQIYNAEFIKEYFTKRPNIRLDSKWSEYFYAIILFFGKTTSSVEHLMYNISGESMKESFKKDQTGGDENSYKPWVMHIPTKGETYFYELRVVLQKREFIEPDTGFNPEDEYLRGIRPAICDFYTKISFHVKG